MDLCGGPVARVKHRSAGGVESDAERLERVCDGIGGERAAADLHADAEVRVANILTTASTSIQLNERCHCELFCSVLIDQFEYE